MSSTRRFGKLIPLLGAGSLLLVSFVAGRLTVSKTAPVAGAGVDVVEAADFEHNEQRLYRFISPLLECDSHYPANFQGIRQGEDRIASLIDSAKARGDITEAAVYFRDLNNGPWFGMNEREMFLPASLLKVPLLMTYLREADSGRSILERTTEYRGAPYPVTQNFVYSESLPDGRYPVKRLLERMIVTSDNTAMSLLTDENLISLDTIETVYHDLGIRSPIEEGYRIDVVAYASFFRVLYNSTYLSRASSEYALDLLSRSGFDQGLRAGVPKDVKVSHKFGERFDGRERQLHDCGIVYAPERPYLLCVMTRGGDFQRLAPVIADISREVYELME